MRLTTRVTDHRAFFIEDVCFALYIRRSACQRKASSTDLISFFDIDPGALHSSVAENV